uniref:Costars domain-containing protein n=1 Tax=Cyprinus carpio TaxID=7962 RepID=A0A8C2JJE1_CYPCA
FAEDHIEGQKLNPFSEEFDYEHAMAIRLQKGDGHIYVTFGRLFDRYVKISDKVVGILLRCRKHKMVDFEGEMLWKGQDDDIIITL